MNDSTSTAVVITMAGRGQRFHDAGYDVPKYAIEVHGRPLFSWSLLSLSSWLAAGADVVFVTRADDRARPFVQEQCRLLGVASHAVVELDSTTDGQASTVLAAEALVRDLDQPLLIYNIDTHVRPTALDVRGPRGDGWLPCFPGRGSAWSFALADEDGRVRDVREKQRISDDATVGLYWFRSFSLYRSLYERAGRNGGGVVAGERYVAPLFNLLIADGCDVWLHRLPADAVVPLGTPAELAAFAASRPPAGADPER